ncbi:monooxygenase [Sulfitobacter sp. EhC04]|uniref:flavin-containing monooxygenase n=1 Tax=Sulfitobacter sp. EhC04 TaxID=1849168 RepID=UPI0007F4596A|nr:NAD(P)/FAD-dependent oxidoreductase [Sulfitobacter sp. EhC04]OAN75942.1 monooxygenase [Sulfitobacter sp. EhC04]
MNVVQSPKIDLSEIVSNWLAAFEAALSAVDEVALQSLFDSEMHWRDLLAFTWSITPHDDRASAVTDFMKTQPYIKARNFRLSSECSEPKIIMRHGRESIEAFFNFETETGRGSGLLRLLAQDQGKAWVLATSLDELKGHEEQVGVNRPKGSAFSRNFGGENWSDIRTREQQFEDREPAVLIIGAGQAGLAIAARLRLLGVDTLMVDKRARVGDIWRERYHSLALHNQTSLNHMPYLPWPSNWPTYLPKDMIAGWLETYAWAMQCNVWNNTEFLKADYEEAENCWSVAVRREDGSERILRPRHVIFANGVAGKPVTPRLPGLDDFSGEVLHTHGYKEGDKWRGKRVVVVGAGTSGHDIAQDLHGNGANVTIIQRGATTVASVKAAGLVHAVYYEGDLSLEECDLVAAASSYPLLVRSYQAAVESMKVMDKDLLDGLAARGFKLDWGEDETGHQMKFRRRHGGYYLNCGCSELIVSGEIGLMQNEDIERFVENGVLMKDGTTHQADLIVTATGYQSQQEVVRELLGEDIADKIGPVWGIDEKGEIANMFAPTAQQGLWFAGGGFAHARIYSKYVALNIAAQEFDLVTV